MDILITLCVIAAAATAARAFSRTRVLAANIAALNARLDVLDRRLPGPNAEQTATPHEMSAPTRPPETAGEAPERAVAPAIPQPPDLLAGRRWEEVLVENWLVWLGGLALALGGAFLVKLSIDHGLLTPAVRVALGILLGIGLWAGASWLAWGEPLDRRPSNVCQALAAAGAATIFASLYAAYRLFGILPPELAFPLLALTSAATVLMAMQHGPFVAALGLSGAFAVPLLVGGETGGALPLFAYLIVVSAASLAVLRHRAWWWLAWVWLAGSIGWALLWLGAFYQPGDGWALGVYLLAQLGLFAALRRGIARVPFMAGMIDAPMVRIVVRSALWAVSFVVLLLAGRDGDSAASLGCAFVAVVALLWFAYRDAELDDVMAAAGFLAAALLAGWNLPLPAEPPVRLLHSLPPEQAGRFLTVAIGFGALLGGGGFLALTSAPRPSRWAALSAAAPPVILAIAYWRVRSFGLDIAWTVIALALAGVELAAAAWAAKRRDGMAQNELVLAAYAVGVLGCTILAAVVALENAWLTVALALHLPALGWVETRLRLAVLRRLALGVAGAVLVRLVLNPEVYSYPLAETPIFNWLLYGYGVPAAAFMVATRQFGNRMDDLLVKILEAGSVVFAVLLVSLQLWHAFGDRSLPLVLDDFERNAVETGAWLAMASWLLHLGERHGRAVLRWSGIVMFAAASIFLAGWQGILLNPLMPYLGAPVGSWLFLCDSLSLAYALPALLYAVIGIRRLGPRPLWQSAQILAAGFAFLWVTLEIRHLFHGERLGQGITGEAEWYAYSAAWLGFASAGLAAALAWRNAWLRRVSLLGIGLVVGKVFLSDMADLSGALRALSFLGLGAVLVATGYAYRRLQPLHGEEPGAAAPR